VQIMRCAYCNRDKAWADGFPNRIYAECWECVWKHHQEAEHKPKNRRWRRDRSVGRMTRCADGSLVHDFKGQSRCPGCGIEGITFNRPPADPLHTHNTPEPR